MSILGVGEAIGGIAQGAGNTALGAGMAAQGAGQAVSGIAQGAGIALAKLGDVLVSPVNMLCDWAKEPLKRAEYNRMEKSKDRDIQREIERETGVQKALSEQKMKETEFSANLQIRRETEVVRIIAEIEQLKKDKESEQKMKETEFSVNLQIRRETEVVRIITEIEQLKKDKEFERMKAVSDAMMRYQNELTRVNVEAVEAIGCMRIELQRKAYELIHEKTQQYAELQNLAIQQAQDQLSRIDNDSSMSEATKNILRNSVDKTLAGVIDNATRFIEQLKEDMQLISKDINLITSSGQKFIERHLSQLSVIGFSNESTSALGSNGNGPEMLPYHQTR